MHDVKIILHSYMNYITINLCNSWKRKQTRPFTRPIFPFVAKNGLGSRLAMVWSVPRPSNVFTYVPIADSLLDGDSKGFIYVFVSLPDSQLPCCHMDRPLQCLQRWGLVHVHKRQQEFFHLSMPCHLSVHVLQSTWCTGPVSTASI